MFSEPHYNLLICFAECDSPPLKEQDTTIHMNGGMEGEQTGGE